MSNSPVKAPIEVWHGEENHVVLQYSSETVGQDISMQFLHLYKFKHKEGNIGIDQVKILSSLSRDERKEHCFDFSEPVPK